ncbi:MAG: 50S ribosomal protein L18 [Gemmatimonadota bacterium]|nr:50S ribosomal protein L18 [Gemmatimonadota bacterium]MDH4352125.1 50S ribosomal protein L18 [Gemmatimonadota bacterium]MDH5195805.1 50S ribosomal protein L18 [Gemmatimonadota bacterium]
MRPIHKPKTRSEHRYRRHLRLRKRVAGTAERPRLVVFRSLKHIYAHLVDDDRGVVLLGVADRSKGVEVEGTGKVARGHAVGKLLAERAKAQGITRAVFDRGGYVYHGRVRAVAEGARSGGLEF